jgi:hypothetical protein
MNVGDIMHAWSQIGPHVMWHAIHSTSQSAWMATSMMDILDEAGIWREVRVMSKAKTPTKTCMPHFDGHDLETMLQNQQRQLDV